MLVTGGIVLSTLKRMKQVGPSKCFIWTNFFLFFDHFRNNDEDDQNQDVLIDANSSLQPSYYCYHLGWT